MKKTYYEFPKTTTSFNIMYDVDIIKGHSIDDIDTDAVVPNAVNAPVNFAITKITAPIPTTQFRIDGGILCMYSKIFNSL